MKTNQMIKNASLILVFMGLLGGLSAFWIGQATASPPKPTTINGREIHWKKVHSSWTGWFYHDFGNYEGPVKIWVSWNDDEGYIEHAAIDSSVYESYSWNGTVNVSYSPITLTANNISIIYRINGVIQPNTPLIFSGEMLDDYD